MKSLVAAQPLAQAKAILVMAAIHVMSVVAIAYILTGGALALGILKPLVPWYIWWLLLLAEALGAVGVTVAFSSWTYSETRTSLVDFDVFVGHHANTASGPSG